jgi:hypothetical protein
MARLWTVALAALVLAGCYISKTPFITPATADYPVADGARFNAFAPAGDTRRARPGRTVRRVGAFYTYREDGRPKPSLPFLMKRVATNLYVVQLSDSADPRKVREYAYQLVVFDGATAIQHKSICPAHAEWLERRLVDRIEETQTRRCIFSDFQHLTTVLREAAKSGAPEAKYVLVPR